MTNEEKYKVAYLFARVGWKLPWGKSYDNSYEGGKEVLRPLCKALV